MGFKKIIIYALFLLLVSVLFYGVFVNTGFALSQPVVKVTPNVISQYGNYEISFVTGKTLYKDTDKVTIYFPKGTVLPCGCTGVAWKATDFAINGITVKTSPDASSIDQSTVITLPVTIPAGSNVIITIKSSADVKNPPDIGYYVLSVATTKETTPVKSEPYFIGYSTVSTPVVNISPSYVNANSDITITFKTGILGTLTKGENIAIKFPNDFKIPGYVPPSFVLVNDNRVAGSSYYTMVKGNVVFIPVPIDIDANSPCKVEFLKRAGIKNPSNPGEYNVEVYTDEEKTPVQSSKFTISPQPKVSTNIIILPDEIPDGKNGYYVHPVTVMLVGISNTGAKVTVHYSLDGGEWKTSLNNSVTISLNDGDHILKYYSTDSNGFKESEKTKTFKIDTSIPTIVLNQPKKDSIRIPTLHYEIKGVVKNADSGTKLYINDKEINLNNGEFSYMLQLHEGMNNVTLLAEDVAGNSSSLNITINAVTIVPKLTIYTPIDWEEIQKDSVTVSGKVDVADSNVTINNQSVALNPDGSFSYNLSLSNEKKGTVPIKIVATAKESGLSTSQVVMIVYNPMPKEIIIKLQIGLNVALVNNKTVQLDSPPFIDPKSNRTLVPIRFISEAFGANVEWDNLTRSVLIKLDSKEIKLQIGNNQAAVNGDLVNLDQPPVIKNNRTMVPIRFIAESFGAKVEWDAATKTITLIYTPSPTP